MSHPWSVLLEVGSAELLVVKVVASNPSALVPFVLPAIVSGWVRAPNMLGWTTLVRFVWQSPHCHLPSPPRCTASPH